MYTPDGNDLISIDTKVGPDGQVFAQVVYLGPSTTAEQRWRNVLAMVITGPGYQAIVPVEQVRSLFYQAYLEEGRKQRGRSRPDD